MANTNSSSSAIQQTIFPNGLVVMTDAMPHVRSVSIGIWINSGSRREPIDLNGISHFIEHMVFKGTGHRTAEDIAREVDRVGGMLDAFTAKEMVCFNTRVLDEHLPIAFDVLADMLVNPRFPEDEITRERSVILEEIRMVEDDPEDLVHELFAKNFWGPHPLGRPILGTDESVSRFDRSILDGWFRRWYTPNNMLITAAGHISHQLVLDLVGPRLGERISAGESHAENPPAPQAEIAARSKAELEQVHLCLGVPSHPMNDPRRYTVALLNNLLGSGMSSRLFQNIREKQGLAYAVFSEASHYHDAGVLSVYAGTSLDTLERLVQSVTAEFRDLKKNVVSDEELRRAKDNLKGATLLSLESAGARMSDLARQYLYYGRYISPENRIAQMESVSREDILALAQEMFRSDRVSAAIVGDLNGFALTSAHLSF
ncbi:MAG TPA: pitrilysin family protein [Candidatus Acidoferrales bacterium]|nr:pitrilysin family protein [Candidatus Acidoferrales bacterium]